MATQVIGTFADGQIVAEIEFNSGNKRITGVVVTNNAPGHLRVTVIDNGTIVGQATFLAGTTTRVNVAGSALEADPESPGWFNLPPGMSVLMDYPAP